MSSQEKARELVDRYYNELRVFTIKHAKPSALICVDEIIKTIPYNKINLRQYTGKYEEGDEQFISYWEEVKNEINRM